MGVSSPRNSFWVTSKLQIVHLPADLAHNNSFSRPGMLGLEIVTEGVLKGISGRGPSIRTNTPMISYTPTIPTTTT